MRTFVLVVFWIQVFSLVLHAVLGVMGKKQNFSDGLGYAAGIAMGVWGYCLLWP